MSLSNFSAFELTRAEMKNVVGGYDYVCCNDMKYCFADFNAAYTYCSSTSSCTKCVGFNI